MGGHNIGVPFVFPWAHLRLSWNDLVSIIGRVYADESLFLKAFPPEHTPTPERAREYASNPEQFCGGILADLNRVRVHEMIRMAKDVGFEIVNSEFFTLDEHRKYLTPDIRAELKDFSEEELLML